MSRLNSFQMSLLLVITHTACDWNRSPNWSKLKLLVLDRGNSFCWVLQAQTNYRSPLRIKCADALCRSRHLTTVAKPT